MNKLKTNKIEKPRKDTYKKRTEFQKYKSILTRLQNELYKETKK